MERQRPKRPTISDVADRAGVSIATVSRVINQNIPVTESTEKRVRQAIKDLKYRPVLAARNLASNLTHTIGLILPQISGDYFPAILKGMEAALKESGYRLIVYSTHHDEESSYNEVLPFGDHIADGLLVFANALDDEALEQYFETEFPVVLLFQKPPEGMDIPWISIENKSGAYQIVDHLIRVHKRRKIVFMRGPVNNDDSNWRETGYLKAFSDNGIKVKDQLLVRGNYDLEISYNVVVKLLDDGIDFDAIFCADDESAIGVLRALEAKGVDVPGKVSVVGFDDVNMAAYLHPPLTTVSVPLEQVGKMAVQQMMKLIAGEPVEQLVLLPTKLVIRKSCGCS